MTSQNLTDTIVVSDLHLSDAEKVHKKRPLWKKFRNKEFFIDKDFADFLNLIVKRTSNSIELILNGDIFDFDSVMSVPENPKFKIENYEKKLGLNSKEDKSVFKIDTILSEHEVWTRAISNFIKRGNKVVFVIGNHDIELNWLKVQKKILDHLKLSKEEEKRLVFCEWFYISQKDTLIEHGHQYDPYCMSMDPINPIIKKNGEFYVRLPFGNLANRFMINAMGFKNPHNDDTYVKSFVEFIKFFFKYELKNQPLIVLDWLKGALRTLIYSVGESFLPRVKDPLTYTFKLKKIAIKSNSKVETVLALRENHAHPAVRKPISVIRELWLDRAFLLFAFILTAWQLFSMIAVFVSISLYWFFLPLSVLLSIFGYYANGVGSEIRINQQQAEMQSILSAKLCNVKRIVLGHTHYVYHKNYKKYEILNPGTWSVFFNDIECTDMVSLFTFVWIKASESSERKSDIYRFKDNEISLYIPVEEKDE